MGAYRPLDARGLGADIPNLKARLFEVDIHCFFGKPALRMLERKEDYGLLEIVLIAQRS
jgi:hypothetical protein